MRSRCRSAARRSSSAASRGRGRPRGRIGDGWTTPAADPRRRACRPTSTPWRPPGRTAPAQRVLVAFDLPKGGLARREPVGRRIRRPRPSAGGRPAPTGPSSARTRPRTSTRSWRRPPGADAHARRADAPSRTAAARPAPPAHPTASVTTTSSPAPNRRPRSRPTTASAAGPTIPVADALCRACNPGRPQAARRVAGPRDGLPGDRPRDRRHGGSLATFLVGGVGPFAATLRGAVPDGDGLVLTLDGRATTGRAPAGRRCRVWDPTYLGNPPVETYVRTPEIAAGRVAHLRPAGDRARGGRAAARRRLLAMTAPARRAWAAELAAADRDRRAGRPPPGRAPRRRRARSPSRVSATSSPRSTTRRRR